MPNRMDSSITEYNEDGTITTTTIETYVPPTAAQKISGAAVLGGVLLAPLVPVVWLVGLGKYEELKKKRKAKLEVVKSDD